MKPKSLLPLFVILAILGGLVLFRQAKNKPVSITEQVKLTELVPDTVDRDAIAKLEMYSGGAPDEKLVLAKNGDGWLVESQFNAPVAKTKIDTYLDTLSELKGEFRAEPATEEGFDAYELGDAGAFHVFGYKADSTEPLFHLLVGKSPKYGNVFMRAAGDSNVYTVDKDLRRDAGVFSDARDAAPTATTWLDKTILTLDKSAIRKVSMTYPDKTLVFENREKPAEEPPAEEAKEGEEAETAEPPAPKPVEREWALASGGFGQTHKQSAFESILSKVANLTATDVVDPAKKADYGLEPPEYAITIAVEGQDADTVLEAGRKSTDGDGYIRVASNDTDIVYQINRYGFEQLFPNGTALFDLPGLTGTAEQVSHFDVRSADGVVTADNVDGTWKLTAPVTPLEPVTSSLAATATALAGWKAQDYADSTEGTGLDAPSSHVEWRTNDGASHSLDVGAHAKHSDGYYVRFDGGPKVLVMLKSDYDKVFKGPKDLFDRSLFTFYEEDINQIVIDRGAEHLVLHKSGDEWILSKGEESFGTNQDVVGDLAFALTGLEATDLDFSAGRVPGAVVATIEVGTEDGPHHILSIEEAKDGMQAVTLEGRPGVVYLLPEASVAQVLPEAGSLTKNEEAPVPVVESSEAAPAPEEAAPADDTPTEPAPAAETPTEPAPATP